METSTWLKVLVIILCSFSILLGSMNAYSYSSASDGSCSGISKSWADAMLILNIVLIFIAVIVVGLVIYEWLTESGKKSIMKNIKINKTKIEEEEPEYYREPNVNMQQAQSRKKMQTKMEPRKIVNIETEPVSTSSIFDEPENISREKYAAMAYNI